MRGHPAPLRLAIAAAVAIAWAGFAPVAGASTIGVTSTADNKTDDQLCTLREAVDAANTNAAVNPAGGNDCPGGQAAPAIDRIVLGSATYALTGAAGESSNASGDLDVTGPSGPVAIEGQGPTVTKIDANDTDRVLDTVDSASLTLRHLTVTDGTVTDEFGGGIRALFADLTLNDVVVSANTINGTNANSMLGAGITVFRSLTMTDSTVGPNNVILSSGAGAGTPRGGGIFLSSGAGLIDRSTIAQNGILGAASQTLTGGGIATQNAEANLTITNSTITENGLLGGGTRHGGGVYWEENGDDDTLRVTNTTFEGNSVGSFQNGGGLYVDGGTGNTVAFSTFGPTTPADMNGAGLYVDGGPVGVRASVFETGTNDDCGGSLPGSLGFNYEKSGDDCFFDQPTDVLTTQQLLDGAGLAGHGGPTETIKLAAASPAIDVVPPASCLDHSSQPLLADQRGVERPFESSCDPGAFEVASCEGQEIGAGWLIGTAGPDSLSGTSGSDLIATGAGADSVDPGAGPDTLCTGSGPDSLQLKDEATDVADCGAGADTVQSDEGVDQLTACELVNIVPPPAPSTTAPSPPASSPAPKKKCKKKKHRRSATAAKKKCKKKKR